MRAGEREGADLPSLLVWAPERRWPLTGGTAFAPRREEALDDSDEGCATNTKRDACQEFVVHEPMRTQRDSTGNRKSVCVRCYAELVELCPILTSRGVRVVADEAGAALRRASPGSGSP
jgi:hypothetical protein